MEKMIYAIVYVKRDPEKLSELLSGFKGIAGAGLYSVLFSEIAAVVRDINRDGLIADRSTAIEYAGVIETLSQKFTLLPMRFGSVMESTDAIEKMIERNYPEIQQNLQKVDNKYEFGLKVLCDSEKLRSGLIAKSTAGTTTSVNPDAEIIKSVYRNWVDKKLKEHRLEELLLAHVDSVIATIKGYLSALNAVTKFKKMLSETTIIDAVFLLEKEQKDTVIKITEDLQNQYPELSFVLTGPWPPYSFVDFTVK
ncbi:MAG: GvpL/GvpF family gas vesicle protein [Bacteroidota bacterium]